MSTNVNADDASSIRATASQWLVRRDAGLTADEMVEFSEWRAAHPAHDAAVRAAERTARLLGRLGETAPADLWREVDELCDPRESRSSGLWPRWAGVLAAAACIAIVASLWFRAATQAPQSVTVAASERTLDLEDGSTLHLDAGSTVAFKFTPEQRRIDLRNGLVHFSVAKDPQRPFVVAAGDVLVQAVGTAFDVRYQAGAVQVDVTEGKVQVTAPSVRGEASPVLLAAGQGVTVSAARSTGGRPGMSDPDRTLSRRTLATPERLVFDQTPLADVIAQFNRASRVQIEIGDAELGSRPVGGTFNADQAEVFVSLLASAGDVRVERVSETHVILRRAQ